MSHSNPNLAITLGNSSNFLAFQFPDLISDDFLFHYNTTTRSHGHTLDFVSSQNYLPLEIINLYILNTHHTFHSPKFLILSPIHRFFEVLCFLNSLSFSPVNYLYVFPFSLTQLRFHRIPFQHLYC